MASGFGITGKKGRCYDVWMDFSDCMSHCSMPAECTSRRDDYFECLHHRKEGALFPTLDLIPLDVPGNTSEDEDVRPQYPLNSVEWTRYSRMNAINKEKERQAFGDKNEKPHDSAGH